MKAKFFIVLALIFAASAGVMTQASAKEVAHTKTQQCVGPAGYCTPYFGS
ncbi:hypothetical protein [Paraburkholderia bryophila]|uniref:Uncharacterized protein n=1 Tax=Paraburkholderia bryophila TaxID=420952 RepID=A0A7Y9W7J2_9BURK|nr:hypothetical protein [Paraburkholderia bryophila]NYH15689.1 hypothetical protein [Paraburkholderia bryophila]NYH25869.1 hypothetical protein [Paraburkholderia bryophila]